MVPRPRPVRIGWLVLIPLQLALLGLLTRGEARGDLIGAKAEPRVEVHSPTPAPRAHARDPLPRSYAGAMPLLGSTVELALVLSSAEVPATMPARLASESNARLPRSRAPPALS